MRIVADNVPALLFALDSEGIFTLSQGEGLQALGYEPGQVVGLSVFEVYRDAPEVLQDFRRVLGGESVFATVEVGGLSFETNYSPLRGQDGEVVGVIGVAMDVTERKLAYNRLAESERRFSTLLANAPAYYYRCRNEPGWPNEFVSDYASEITGCTPEELIDGTVMFADLIVEEDRERVWGEVQDRLKGGARFKLGYTIRRKDGEVRHVEEHGQGVYGDDGEVVALEGVVHDVTERERSERRLREAEERYRALVERTPAVTYVQDATGLGAMTYVSPQIKDLVGYEPEECTSDPKHWTNILHPADRERVLAEDARSNETGEPFRMEYRQIAKDGRVVWVRDEADLVRDKEGLPLFWLGVQYDVTERREAEEEEARRARQAELRADVGAALAASGTLRDILQRFVESVVRNLDAAFARVWILNREEEVLELRASAGMYDHLDGSHSRVPVGSFKIGLIAEERRPHLTNDVANDPRTSDKGWAEREGMVAFAGYPLMVEGRLVGVAAMFAREPLEEDTVDALASVADAVAQGVERKRAEEELRRSESSLAEAQRIAHVGDWEYDVVKDEARWSDEMYRVFGFAPRSFVPTYKSLLASAHPDDRGRLRKAVRKALYREKQDYIEYRIVRPDGEVRCVLARYEVIRDGGGAPIKLSGTVQDVTERERNEEALRESEERYRLVARATSEVIWDNDLKTGGQEWDGAIEAVFGYARGEVGEDGSWWEERVHPEDRRRVLLGLEEVLEGGGEVWTDEYRFRRGDGAYATVVDRGYVVRDGKGKPARMLGAMLDVTERKAEEERLRRFADAAFEGILITEAGRILEVNEAFVALLGRGPEELIGESALAFVAPEYRDEVQRKIGSGSEKPYEIAGIKKDGARLDLEVRGRAFSYHGRPVRVTAVRDISNRKALERRLRHQALHDTLTGLPNRALLTDRVEQALARARRRGSKVAVLFMDLDNFKYINDSLGHQMGDLLLVEVSARLRECLRPGDTAARLGGDEFVLLLEEVEGPGEAASVAERVIDGLRKPFALDGRGVFITPSIGIALGDPGRDSSETLLRDADIAMYRAKGEGKARHRVFEPGMETRWRAWGSSTT